MKKRRAETKDSAAMEEKRRQKIKNSIKKAIQNSHVNPRSLLYVMKIYRKAVGKKTLFFWFCRLYDAVLPSATAVLSGAIITAISNAVTTHDLIPFIVLIAVLLGLQLIRVILNMIRDYMSSRIYLDIETYVNEQVALKYIQTPMQLRENREFADRFERVKSFADSVPWVTTSILETITSTIALISIIAATMMVSPIITGVIVLSAIPASVLSMKIAAKRRGNWREYTRERRIAWNIQNKITNSSGALEIEMNNLGKYLISRMVKANRKAKEQDVAVERQYLMPMFGSNIIEVAVEFLVLIFVALGIIYGMLAIGQFFTIHSLLQQLRNNVSNLFSTIMNVSENMVKSTDYMEFMETPSRPNGNIEVMGLPRIEFKNVSFRYPNATVDALSNVSFVLEPGDSLAVVGRNGAGKSTLIKLLIGAYEPSGGVVLINGHPLAEIERNSFLAQIGALLQDFSRYDFATLGENVWFGNTYKQYDVVEIEKIMAQADLEGFSKRFQKGLQQILSKDIDDTATTDLSGGQWQRLAIARTLYRSPNILLLDEPTSAIVAKSESEIFKNILSMQKGKTTVIVSHRFSAVRKAKQIIVLEQGKVVESGSHDELVAKNGVYKELFEAQAEGYR